MKSTGVVAIVSAIALTISGVVLLPEADDGPTYEMLFAASNNIPFNLSYEYQAVVYDDTLFTQINESWYTFELDIEEYMAYFDEFYFLQKANVTFNYEDPTQYHILDWP